MTVEEIVRDMIGDGGPQLPADEYEARINQELEHIRPEQLLWYISRAIEKKFEALDDNQKVD